MSASKSAISRIKRRARARYCKLTVVRPAQLKPKRQHFKYKYYE